ncbi:MAG: hypothetical protein J6A59_10560 [Lachnospiraceae bacterium]|nr:hypothetical protein [Lachnospiraceae bacterium]
MRIGTFKPYKDITGTIEIDNNTHRGKLIIDNGLVDYTADSLEELEVEFHKAVDDYLYIMNELKTKE